MAGMTLQQLKELRSRPVPATGNRLADAFDICKVSQAEFSRETGLKQQYVSDVKHGRVPDLTRTSLYRFANYFGCLIEDLFPSREEVAS